MQSSGIAEPDLRAALDLVGAGHGLRCGAADRASTAPLCARAWASFPSCRGPGLAALAEVAKAAPPFTAYHLGFVFGPRINAGGRVGRSSWAPIC